MGTQPESRLSRQIMESLRQQGHFCFKVHGSEYMMAGLPDIIVCAAGLFIGLEVKHERTRSHTSARQKLVHELINESGGLAVVVCSPTEARDVVDELLKRSKRLVTPRSKKSPLIDPSALPSIT